MVYFDARERIARADLHFQVGIKLWDKFTESEPYDYFPEIKADGTGTIKVIPRYNPLPTDFGIEFGEMLYQLRATLDSIVYQAAIYDSGQDPPPDAERLEFPFRDTPTAFEQSNVARKIAPLAPKRQAIIESVQPYHAPHVSPDERATIWGLAALNHWARIDRHRRLHVIGSWISREAQPEFRPPPGTTIRSLVVAGGPGYFLEDENIVASFVVDGWEPSMHFEANPKVFIDISINEPSPLGPNPTLTDASNAIMQAVQVVVKRFESS